MTVAAPPVDSTEVEPAGPVETPSASAAPPSTDALAELRAENEALRAAVGTEEFTRLLKELHSVAGRPEGPAGTALLERPAGRTSWTVRATAGRELTPAALRTLPEASRPPHQAEPLHSPAPSLAGAWAVPVAGGGRTGLWLAPPPPTGEDEGRGRRLWQTVGDALWRRFVTSEALGAARSAISLRDAQVALYAAASAPGEPQEVLARLLKTLAAACDADRAILHTTEPNGRRIACAGAERPRPVAAVAAEMDAKLAAAVPFAVAALEDPDDRVAEFDRTALGKLGVKTLIGRAFGVTLGGGAASAAVLVVKGDAAPFPPHARKALAWAGGFFADVLPRCTKAAAATRLARRDGLTGLANRRAFDEQLSTLATAAKSSGGDLALLMLDLDHFKSVNDTHGHAEGDRVLKEAAGTIRMALTECRSDDVAVAARYGGEELVVLLPDFGPSGALRVAERIREAVSRIELPPGGPRTHVTTSVGIAMLPFDGDGPEALLHAADGALYAAKTGGRNRVVRAGATDQAVASPAPR